MPVCIGLFLFFFLSLGSSTERKACQSNSDCSDAAPASLCFASRCFEPCSLEGDDCQETNEACFSDLGVCSSPCSSSEPCSDLENEENPSLTCIFSQCRTTEERDCQKTEDCLEFGQTCRDGVCSSCEASGSCGSSHCCHSSGKCIQKKEGETTCQEGSLCSNSDECSSPGLCFEGVCAEFCQESKNCKFLNENLPCCNKDSGVCQGKVGSGCGKKTECKENNDCSSGLICNESVCKKKDWDICG